MICLGLNAFVRNLNHFFGTKVPEKLQKLLSCIRDATKLCVKFDFFDQEDSIVVVSVGGHGQDSQFLRFLFIFSQSLLSKVDSILHRIKFIDSKIVEVRRKKWDQRESVPKISFDGRLSMYGNEREKMTRRKFNGTRKSKVCDRFIYKNSLPLGVSNLSVCVSNNS